MSFNTITLSGVPCAFVTPDMLTESFLSELLLQQDNLTRLVILPEGIGGEEVQAFIDYVTAQIVLGTNLDECVNELHFIHGLESKCFSNDGFVDSSSLHGGQVEMIPYKQGDLSPQHASLSLVVDGEASQSRANALLASIEASLTTGSFL